MNIPSTVGLTNFVFFFLVFRHRFFKKFLCWFSWTLLIVFIRKYLRWVDFYGLFSSCFSRHSKMASHLGCFEWYNLKWDSFASPCLDWSIFHKTLKNKYWSFRHCFYFICEPKFYARRHERITRQWKSTLTVITIVRALTPFINKYFV